MKQYIFPKIFSCGYFDSDVAFGSIKSSPEEFIQNTIIELFLEDAKSTFINGVEYKPLQNWVFVGKRAQKKRSLFPYKVIYTSYCSGRAQEGLGFPAELLPRKARG